MVKSDDTAFLKLLLFTNISSLSSSLLNWSFSCWMIIWWSPPASLSGCEYWGSIKYWGLKTPESGMLWFVWAVSTQCYNLLLLTGSTIQFILYFSCIFILLRIPVSCISQQRTKLLRLPSKQLTLNIVSFIVLFISRWQFQAGLITAGYQCSVLYRMVRLYNTSLLPPAADCSDQATTMSKNFYNDSFPSSACLTAKTGWRGRWLLQPTVIF